MEQANAGKQKQWRRGIADWTARLLPVPVVLVVWELVARSGAFNAELFPPPSRVWAAFLEMGKSGLLWSDLLASTKRAVVGYVLGCMAGIAVGIATGRVRILDRALSQIIHILRAFPPVAIVPFAITWFGLAESSKYFLVFWGVFFPVWVNTHAGMAGVDKTYLWAAVVDGEVGPECVEVTEGPLFSADSRHVAYLAEGKGRGRLWQRVAVALGKCDVPRQRIDHLVASDNPSLLANLVKELLDRK